MSWLSAETRKVRKALNLPPLTLRTGIAAVLSGGTSVGISTGVSLSDKLHSSFSRAVDRGLKTTKNARQADTVVTAVKSNAVPLLLVAAAVVAFIYFRKR